MHCFFLRARVLDHKHLDQYIALLLPQRLPHLVRTKTQLEALLPCLYLSAAVQRVTAETNSASADPELTCPLTSSSFTSQICLCVLFSLCTDTVHTSLPWPYFWIRKIIVFKGSKEVLDFSNPS